MFSLVIYPKSGCSLLHKTTGGQCAGNEQVENIFINLQDKNNVLKYLGRCIVLVYNYVVRVLINC